MASVAVLGPGELALRVPSALAAIATALLLAGTCARRLGRPGLGAIAALVLATSPGFVGHHVARTGDADAMLALWLTAAVLAVHGWLEGGARRDDYSLWVGAGAFALALLTKGAAALLVVPGIALGAVLLGRWREVLACRRVWLAAAASVVPVLAWYVVREAAAPGYLAAVRDLELRRMVTTVEHHLHPPWFYLQGLAWGRFLPWLFLLPLPFLVPIERSVRRLAIFAGTVAVSQLAVISLSRTKLVWYDAPFYPLAALVVAAGIDGLARVLASGAERWARPVLTWTAVVLAVVALPWGAAVHRAGPPATSPEDPRTLDASWLLKDLHRDHPELRRVAVLADGYDVHLRAYRPILAARGVTLLFAEPGDLARGTVVLATSPALAERLRASWSVASLDRHGGAELLRLAAGRLTTPPRTGAGA
jgi:4-amino-4-deoxy-L-arabinose transferase-like glycosyltransferase